MAQQFRSDERQQYSKRKDRRFAQRSGCTGIRVKLRWRERTVPGRPEVFVQSQRSALQRNIPYASLHNGKANETQVPQHQRTVQQTDNLQSDFTAALGPIPFCTLVYYQRIVFWLAIRIKNQSC
jgi:hypothetical protein